MSPLGRRIATLVWVALLLPWAASGAPLEPVPLPAAGLRQGDQFGAAVAAGGGVIAVGAYLSDAGGRDSGAVYLFRKVGASWEAFPGEPLRGTSGEWFGFDVALDGSGTILVVGAPSPGKGTGTAYVYDVNAGQGVATPRRRLAATASASGDELGSAVAIDGDWVAIGSRGADQRAGRVYVFPVAGGEPTVLVPSRLVAGAELGQSVSLRGATLAVGAPLPGRDGKAPGAVYRSRLAEGSWGALEPLPVPAGLEARAAFGYSVSVVNGQTGEVVVGAPLANSEAGAVYLSTDTQPLRAGARGDQLGVAVAADGGRMIFGARGADGGRGAAYLIGPDEKLTAKERKAGAELGFSAAIRGDTIVVGAFRENGTGAAYAFEAEPPVLQISLQGPGSVQEAAGFVSIGVVLTVLGSPSTAEVEVELSTANGTAEEGSDYGEVEPKTVKLGTSPNDRTRTVRIPIMDDTDAEPDESFEVNLTTTDDRVQIEPSSLLVTILDDDCVTLNLPPALTVTEGGSTEFFVSLPRQPDAPVILRFTSSELGMTPSRVRFKPDAWDSARRVEVSSEDDSLCNGDRSIALDVTAESNDPQFSCIAGSIPGTLLDDGDPSVEVAARVCVNEDDTVLYTVEVKNPCGAPLPNDPNDPEILDPLPEEVTLVTASADIGVATVDHVENEVAWNGSIPGGSTAKIEILAALEPGILSGTEVEYQGFYRNSVVSDPVPFDATFVVGQATLCPGPPPE
jgi:uncharacterized repeat protein (TIGR01451 family)